MSVYNFATANLSFAFALGKKMGSEKKWLEKIAKTNKSDLNDEEFLKKKAKNTMELIVKKFTQNRLDAIGLQELNAYDFDPGIKTFQEAFQEAFKSESESDVVVNDLIDKVEKDVPMDGVEVNIKNIGKYCIISFGVDLGPGVPTVALIYNTEKLGTPKKIFCEDCEVGLENKGRPMLGVITDMNFGLISMHAPNVNPYLNPPPHLKANQDPKLRTLMDGEKMQKYFKRLAEKDTVSDELSQINTLIDTQFMTPMVDKITKFISKLNSQTNKIVLMGDMNDADPNNELSLSNRLKNGLGLQFSPGNPTCCYNWDSSKIGDGGQEYTNWIFGHSHPDDTINEEVINRMEGDLANVKNMKSQKKNYAFKGDLIYYTTEFELVEKTGQGELFPHRDTITSQYSDHVFQKIALQDKPNTPQRLFQKIDLQNKPNTPRRQVGEMVKQAMNDLANTSLKTQGGKVRKTKKVRKRPTKKRKRPIKKRKHTKKRKHSKKRR